MTSLSIKDFDTAMALGTTSKAGVSKLVQAWEAKNADRAKRIAGLGLMAVSLAACGGSDDDTAAPVTPVDPVQPVDPTPPAPALSALQSAVAEVLLAAGSGVASADAATLALASNAVAKALTGTTTNPSTVAATEEMIGDAAEQMILAADGILGGSNIQAILEDLGGGVIAAGDGAANFGLLVEALSATTSADRADLLVGLTAIEDLLDGNAATNALALTAAKSAWGVGANLTAAEAADLAALKAIATLLVNNNVAALNADAIGATAVETANGAQVFASTLVTAVAAAAGVTLTAAQKAGAIADLLDGAGLINLVSTLVQDLGNGNVLGLGAGDSISNDIGAAAAAIDAAVGGGATAANDWLNGFEGIAPGAAAPGSIDAYINAEFDVGYDAAVTSRLNTLIDAVKTVASAENGLAALDVQATIIELQNDGTAITIGATGDLDATASNDVFAYLTSSDANLTIADFGADGTDTLMISGQYVFTKVTEAQVDAGLTDAVGSASVLEIFVYEDATTGDTTLFIERSPGEGSVEDVADVMSSITLNDVAFADLTSLVAGGVTILTSEAAAAA